MKAAGQASSRARPPGPEPGLPAAEERPHARVLPVAGYRLRGTWRRRLPGYLALTLLAGLLGGVALAAVTAARRTDSSYPDYLAGTRPSALIIQPNANGGGDFAAAERLYRQLLSRIRHLPHVRGLTTADALNAATLTPRGHIASLLFTQVQLVASRDGMFSRQDRVTIVAGHPATRPDQVVATVRAAAQLHLHVGSRLPVGLLKLVSPHGIPPVGRRLTLTVSGIGVLGTQIVQDDIDADRTGFLIGTPSLDRRFGSGRYQATSYVGLRLAGGFRYSTAVSREFEQLETSSTYYAGGNGQLLQLLEIYDTAAIQTQAQRSIRPEAIALAVFGLIAGLVALLLGAQSAARQLQAGAADSAVLRALGAGPVAALADGVLGILAAIGAGALLAAVVAIGLSPFSLFGPVRQAEPGRGFYLDWSVLGLGAAALALILALAAAIAGYRQAPHRAAARQRRPGRGSAVVRAGLSAGLAPAAVAGLRFALEPGRGRTAVPVRSVIAGAVLAVGVGAAALTFGASLTNLVAHPGLYGWNFGYALYSTDGWGPFPPALTDPVLHRDHQIAASTGVYFATVEIDGQTVPAIVSPARAAIAPRPLTGHRLDGQNQIVLGPATLAQLHKQVGDTVTVRLGQVIPGRRLTIAGTAALPAIGDTLSIHPSLSTGAVLPQAAVSRAGLTDGQGSHHYGPNAIFIRLRPGVSQAAGLRSVQKIADLYNQLVRSPQIEAQAGLTALQLQASALPAQRPAEIVNYRTMGAMPAVLAGGLAAGAVAGLGLTLVASVRRRRRDLALLKTLGFTRRQLAGAVGWQATAVAAAGLAFGLPLGIAAGRWLWLAFARELSAVPAVTIPAASIAAAALAALVLANLVAALPGRAAARTAAALALRAE